MWRSGGAQRVSAPVQRTGSRFRARLSLWLTLVVAFLVVVFVFPLIFQLRIDVPANVQFGTASAVSFEVENQNLTPLTNITYSCRLSKLETLDGSPVEQPGVLSRGNIKKIGARHGVRGRCEAGFIVTVPVKTVEYQLTITYQAYPWPQQRTRLARISAQTNAKGEVTGWKVD